MKNYQYQALILIIIFALLPLVSNSMVRRVTAGSEKRTPLVDQKSEIPALDANRHHSPTTGLLSEPRAALPALALTVEGGSEPAAPLAMAGLTFTVNSTADPGNGVCDAAECTLREAITAANAAAGSDTITFNIPNPGPHTITPLSSLPAITSPVVIDGYTQPGAIANTLADGDNAVLMIELDGSQAGALNVLSISAGTSTVRGLVINHSTVSRAISMDTNGGNIIEGNFIGTNVAGTAVSGNDYGVIVSFGSANNLIGGTTPAARNIISGNNNGIGLLGGPGNTIQGNFIGTDHTGVNDLGNVVGVGVTADSNNTIGGAVAGARNVISGNGTEIRMQADNNLIQGNYIGVSATGGAFNYSNATPTGVFIFSSTGNTVGGTTPAARNVISGHAVGLSLNNAALTTVQGNFIGTDASGTTRLGNTTAGIDVSLSNGTVIGGTAAGAGNLISANGNGIQISPNTSGITIQVQGNLIGTDVNGTADLGNTGDGVLVTDSSTNVSHITIGGTASGAGNIISGNDGDGIDIRSATGIVIQGNFIGTQIDGLSPLGNSEHGLNILQSSSTTIGGTGTGAANRIAFNGGGSNSGGGVIIDGTTAHNNSVRGNAIFGNTSNGTLPNRGLGIDLAADGLTANDPNPSGCPADGDSGPNNLQNFPVLASAISGGGTTTITGTLNSTAGTSFTIDFYSSGVCDASGRGEGQTFLGSTTITTDSGCSASINATLAVSVPSGNVLTATATDPNGNTSEFSPCLPAAPPSSSISGISGSGVYNGTATLIATLSSGGSSLGGKTISFTLNSTSVGNATTDSSGLAMLSGVSLSGINAGTYANTVGASFAGDANYASSSGTGTLTVGKASQAISVGTHAPASAAFNSSFTTAASSNSGLPVAYGSSGACTNSGPVFNMTAGTGNCTVNYDQSGDSNFNPASQVTESVTAQKAGQTITFGTLAGKTFGDPDFTVSATASSGLSVDFSAAGNCTVSNSTVHLTGAGACTITASQAGDSNYNAATPVDQSFTIAAAGSTIQFEQPSYNVTEDVTVITVTVVRTGDTSGAATVEYATADGTASERSDYTTAVGTLRFTAGEASQTIELLISEDSYPEGPETFSVRLSNPVGATLGAQATATVQIADDISEPATNAIDDTSIFVGQHYHDFLNRQADAPGFDFWTKQIDSCGVKVSCHEIKRQNVSVAYYLSIEFEATGSEVIRMYKASFTNTLQRPRGLPRYREFLRDAQEIGRGVVVGQGNWQQQLADNILNFARQWVARPEVLAALPDSGTNADQYVDTLFLNSEVTPSASERNEAIAAFGSGGVEGRARALLSVTASASVFNRQYNSAFVLMEYIGYLRRNPDDAPDANFDGFDFWLRKLDAFSLPGEDMRDPLVASQRIQRSEMVKAFISSIEYRRRFGQ
jgi:CSLREA domain-containing protein